jgi:hypothetical protein
VMEAVTSWLHAHWNAPVTATKTRRKKQSAVDGCLITTPPETR